VTCYIIRCSLNFRQLKYEKAYCLYRMQEIEKAKELLENWKEDSFRKKELLAQIHYRLDNYEEAFDLTRDLIKVSDDDMDAERKANLSAIVASLKLSGSVSSESIVYYLQNVLLWNRFKVTNLCVICHDLQKKPVPQIKGNTYEMEYNHATALIGEGKLDEAEALLTKVEKSAMDALIEEEATEEDIADEVGLVT